ncbi:MAG: hypothetical protein WAQ52_02660 [Terriglobales bacterium]
MNRITILVFSAVLFAGMCWAQSSAGAQASTSASQNTQVSADKSGAQASSKTDAKASQDATASGNNGQVSAANQLKAGSTVQAELTKPVDVRKNRPGDEVVAKTTQDVKSDGHVVLPKGSKIVGRVTQAQARAKGQEESQLGMVFDHAILKDGTQMPVAFTIQAIGRSESEAAAAAAAENDNVMAGGNAGGMTSAAGNAGMQGRGGLGGVTSAAGSVVNTTGSAAGTTLNTAGSASAGVTGSLGATSQGVVGLPGMTLSSATSSRAGVGSVISSKNSNVRLDSGTRMILGVSK